MSSLLYVKASGIRAYCNISLIKFSHPILYAETLEGQPDTEGWGEIEVEREMKWGGGEKDIEKKRCTPHLSSSKTSTLLIRLPGFCREGPQHTDAPYLQHTVRTNADTAHSQLYQSGCQKTRNTLVLSKASG